MSPSFSSLSLSLSPLRRQKTTKNGLLSFCAPDTKLQSFSPFSLLSSLQMCLRRVKERAREKELLSDFFALFPSFFQGRGGG